jgi:tetratricopeptide (TPR) repeat protein
MLYRESIGNGHGLIERHPAYAAAAFEKAATDTSANMAQRASAEHWAAVAWRLGHRHNEAKAAFERALGLARDGAKDEGLTARIGRDYANMLTSDQGQVVEAYGVLESILEMLDQKAQAAEYWATMSLIGQVHWMDGRKRIARKCMRRANRRLCKLNNHVYTFLNLTWLMRVSFTDRLFRGHSLTEELAAITVVGGNALSGPRLMKA